MRRMRVIHAERDLLQRIHDERTPFAPIVERRIVTALPTRAGQSPEDGRDGEAEHQRREDHAVVRVRQLDEDRCLRRDRRDSDERLAHDGPVRVGAVRIVEVPDREVRFQRQLGDDRARDVQRDAGDRPERAAPAEPGGVDADALDAGAREALDARVD